MTTVRKFPSIYHQHHQHYVDAGYQPRPVTPGSKKCLVPGWSADVATVAADDGQSYGLGLRLGTKLPDGTFLVVLDVDRDEFVKLARALVPSPCGRIGRKGIALFARVAEPTGAFDLKLADGSKAGELLGTGSHCVIPPTVHPDTKRPYDWTDRPLLEVHYQLLPLLDLELVTTVFVSKRLAQVMSGDTTHNALFEFIGELAYVSDDFDYIAQVVAACFPDGYRGDSLKELPRMMRDTARKYETGEWTRAQAAGGAPAFSEDHLALVFAERYGNEFRHVKNLGWLRWDGQRWSPDDRKTVFDCARALCREFAARAHKTLKRTVASAKTRAAIVSLAESDQRLAAVADEFDQDPWLLNIPGGTLELKTGRLRPHDPSDRITKITATTPDRNCSTPVWTAFLGRVTGGDGALQAYLQRRCGYELTGVTDEHALFFDYGTGANGKSTYLRTITGIAGDYARPVPMEALL